MSAVFADTSAFVALLNPSDHNHLEAVRSFGALQGRQAVLVTTSYVLVETYAVMVRQQGLASARRFRIEFAGLLEVQWVGQELHDAGTDRWLARGERHFSLVDAVSLEFMRRQRLHEAFAFDRHFAEAGFHLPR